MAERLINEEIKASEVILIDEDGNNEGKIIFDIALEKAKNQGLDLVRVNEAEIPVCKIMNLKKEEYKKKKSIKKSSNASSKIKEMRFSPKITEHDIKVKTKHIDKFLEDGHKVKVCIMIGKKDRRLSSYYNEGAFKSLMDSILKFITVPYKINGKINYSNNEYSTHISKI